MKRKRLDSRILVNALVRAVAALVLVMAALLFGSMVAKADVVLEWNAIAVDTAIANGTNPVDQSRYAAIVQLAVFQAINAITGRYEPYQGSVIAAPHGASAEAAAIQAAYHVLVNFFPNSQPTLDMQRAASLALIPDGDAKTHGVATGDAAATAMIALRANDGSSPPKFYIPESVEPGKWQATPSCPVMNGVAAGTFLH